MRQEQIVPRNRDELSVKDDRGTGRLPQSAGRSRPDADSYPPAGAETLWMPLDQVKAWHHSEIAKYRDIITKAGIAQIE